MRSSVTLLLLLFVLGAHAQSDELIVQGQTGGLYLEHKVMPKETWYSVGRLYNVDAKALAQYNHLTFAHPLAIDQTVKVPLTKTNFSQDGKKGPGESLIAVYHIVGEKEWLYRISVNHNKVPIPTLEKWNGVTGDQVHAGLHMVVGFLKVKTATSALSKKAGAPVAAHDAGTGAPAGSNAHPAERLTATTDAHEALDAKVDSVAKQEYKLGTNPTDSFGKSTKKAIKSEVPVTRAETPAGKGEVPAGKGEVPASKGEVPANKGEMPSSKVETSVTRAEPTPQFNGGKFRSEFNDGGKMVSGQAGVFKSTSGWQDGKYYALINNVPVGTIVKITDQATGKSVYAKVLGQLPEMKESVGLLVRLSNAAAAELRAGDGKFGVSINY